MNNNTSDEDKHDTNHNNKYNDMNMEHAQHAQRLSMNALCHTFDVASHAHRGSSVP